MKFFLFFIIENFMVVGRSLCHFHKRSVTFSCREQFPNFDTIRRLPNEIAPPLASKVNGIERTELEKSEQWKRNPKWNEPQRNGGRTLPRRSIRAAELLPPLGNTVGISDLGLQVEISCKCANNIPWKNLDSNDDTGVATGTGDHESFK